MNTTVKITLLAFLLLCNTEINSQIKKNVKTKTSFNTDTLTLNGSYTGVDLYVLNPAIYKTIIPHGRLRKCT